MVLFEDGSGNGLLTLEAFDPAHWGSGISALEARQIREKEFRAEQLADPNTRYDLGTTPRDNGQDTYYILIYYVPRKPYQRTPSNFNPDTSPGFDLD